MDKVKGYKTVIFGSLVALIPLLEKFDITKFEQFIPDKYESLLVSGIGFLVILLRFLTTSAVGKKD